MDKDNCNLIDPESLQRIRCNTCEKNIGVKYPELMRSSGGLPID